MDIQETGIILFCEDFEKALKFYTEKLGMNVRMRGNQLAMLDFGGSYLLLEDGGVASEQEKTRSQNCTVLRFNVRSFDIAVAELLERGVAVDVRRFTWGTVGIIIDPEGNRIELKE